MEIKYFTPKEATQTLPLVKKIVEDILKTGKLIRALSMEREKAEEDPEIIRLMDQLDDLFDELESIGCSYKDWNFSEGLVDFPAILDDKEVYLCWKSDEEGLQYYHDVDAGYNGRKLIPKEYFL